MALVLICKVSKETTLGSDSVWERADSLKSSGISICMAASEVTSLRIWLKMTVLPCQCGA